MTHSHHLSCLKLTNFLESTGRWDDLVRLCERAEQLEIVELKKYNSTLMSKWLEADTYQIGWYAYRAGWIYYLRGQSKELFAASRRVLEYWKNAGPNEKAAALRLHGLVYKDQENYSAATDIFVEVLKLRRQVKPPGREVAVALNDLAKIELITGHLKEAEKNFTEALNISKRIDNQEDIAANTGGLAELALHEKNWGRAKTLAAKALELAELNGLLDSIAINCLRIGNSLLHQNLLSEGLTYAGRAVEIFAGLGSSYLDEARETFSEIEKKIKGSNSNN